jgi:hypothetical protein
VNAFFSRWAKVIAVDGMYAGFSSAKTGHVTRRSPLFLSCFRLII